MNTREHIIDMSHTIVLESHKTGNNGQLRLNYDHMGENNANARENNARIPKLTIFTHLAPKKVSRNR